MTQQREEWVPCRVCNAKRHARSCELSAIGVLNTRSNSNEVENGNAAPECGSDDCVS